MEKRLQNAKDSLSIHKEQIKNEPENTLKYKGLSINIGSWESTLKRFEQHIEESKGRQNEFNKLDLFETGIGNNSHRRGFKEFKNGI